MIETAALIRNYLAALIGKHGTPTARSYAL
jgi:hypothetical protein